MIYIFWKYRKLCWASWEARVINFLRKFINMT